jgi:hypothetical protein
MTTRYKSPLRTCYLPFDPVRRICESRYRGDEESRHVSAIADMLEVDRFSVYRWERNGINMGSADRVAVKLGLHPSMIWPEWWHV